jgi:glycosyltransferase involved in cell wall biosynthesis
MARWLELPLVASVQPTPLFGLQSVVVHDQFDSSSRNVASMPGVAAESFVLSERAIEQVHPPLDATLPAGQALWEWSQRAIRSGWRHVAAPDVFGPVSGIDGVSNEQLEVQQLWGRTRHFGLDVLIDGRCFGAEGPPTGTHHVVTELARHMALNKPEARLTLAVGRGGKDQATSALGSVSAVTIEEWNQLSQDRFDIVYRPYQFLRESDVGWTFGIAQRVLLGQLDMIGFSNRSYHPSESMFQAARNLQRATLRTADRVITISDFSRETILAEVPDLESSRLSVVPCGADHVGAGTLNRPMLADRVPKVFLVCLAATFFHKNRIHAIRTTLELRQNGIDVGLVIAGPEPHYGSSVADEDLLMKGLSIDDRSAILRVGPVTEPEKWWLLEHASAVLYPSVVEGFGLVPFEAASVGTPALMGRTAALPEIFGPDVTLVDSWDTVVWADIVRSWLNDPSSSSRQVAAIRQRADEYTWAKAAEATWRAIEQTVGTPRRSQHLSEGPQFLAMESHRLGGSPLARRVRNVNRLIGFFRRRMQTFAERLRSSVGK